MITSSGNVVKSQVGPSGRTFRVVTQPQGGSVVTQKPQQVVAKQLMQGYSQLDAQDSVVTSQNVITSSTSSQSSVESSNDDVTMEEKLIDDCDVIIEGEDVFTNAPFTPGAAKSLFF